MDAASDSGCFVARGMFGRPAQEDTGNAHEEESQDESRDHRHSKGIGRAESWGGQARCEGRPMMLLARGVDDLASSPRGGSTPRISPLDRSTPLSMLQPSGRRYGVFGVFRDSQDFPHTQYNVPEKKTTTPEMLGSPAFHFVRNKTLSLGNKNNNVVDAASGFGGMARYSADS